jgi:hypothetical protein
VNQIPGYVESPSQQPQNQQNCENRPKHQSHLASHKLATLN